MQRKRTEVGESLKSDTSVLAQCCVDLGPVLCVYTGVKSDAGYAFTVEMLALSEVSFQGLPPWLFLRRKQPLKSKKRNK